ncbi:signal transduction histidine kinase [Shewanella psychrophila]|uniref:Signal transduction histidine kinase n=1 Tax=Shewanella psychrophila TaxID=225848 RepID=A0A1S6HSE8_9GAMM|nr:sensor histidine kinase [Shewanella psychrophila]AQS38460.1 signal transduction histidine kinase [Shewanella psychrophila]
MNNLNTIVDSEKRSLEDKLAWVYLINLIFYLIPLFIGSKPIWQIVISLITLLPFIYCYFWAYRSPKKKAIYPILAMIALGIAITPINTGSLSLFTFAGFFIGFNYSLRTAFISLIGFVSLLAAITFILEMNHYNFITYGGLLIAGVGLFGVAERKRVEAHCRAQKSKAEISQLATMLERERIARDLHDIMGHNLSSISLKAELAAKLLDKNQIEQAKLQLRELNEIARDSLSQVRQTVSGYKHKGLSSSVMHLCQTLRDKGLSVSLEGDIPQLNPKLETQVILSLTELCNNVIRHSQADHCSLTFSTSADELTISITDNGKTAKIIEGNGLKGIRERLKGFQGKLDYMINQQCRFTITLPPQKIS